MEVNNKYQVGQKVYFLDNGKAKCDEVMRTSTRSRCSLRRQNLKRMCLKNYTTNETVLITTTNLSN